MEDPRECKRYLNPLGMEPTDSLAGNAEKFGGVLTGMVCLLATHTNSSSEITEKESPAESAKKC